MQKRARQLLETIVDYKELMMMYTCAMKEVQTEIRSMNETLVTLANELKHTNEHLARHERKIDEIDSVPKQRIQQIVTAIIAALSGGLISTIIVMILV